MAKPPPRLVLAYQRQGFTQIGGLKRIALTVIDHLSRSRPELALATLSPTPAGVLAHTRQCQRLRPGDQVLIVGCSSPWAYGFALWARLRNLPVSWMPSFHDPRNAIHGRRARLAQHALKVLQLLKVVMYVQTEHEAELLESGRPGQCRLSSHGIPPKVRQALRDPAFKAEDVPKTDRPIDLLFLGRPTEQKGWSRFQALAQCSGLRCEAIVPFLPSVNAGTAAACKIKLHLQASDATVAALLAGAKLMVIPANYESFGIAQLEALMAGCVVPILGHWPLWEGYPELQWRQLDTETIAQRCRSLCRKPDERDQLVQRQMTYLRQHSVMNRPILPALP